MIFKRDARRAVRVGRRLRSSTPGRARGPADWLGLAIGVGTLPWLGLVPTWPRHRRRPWHGWPDSPGGPGGDRLLRASGEDPDGSSAAGGAVPGVAGPDDTGVEGAGRVPAGARGSTTHRRCCSGPVIHNTGRNSPLVSPGAVGRAQASRVANSHTRTTIGTIVRGQLLGMPCVASWSGDRARGEVMD